MRFLIIVPGATQFGNIICLSGSTGVNSSQKRSDDLKIAVMSQARERVLFHSFHLSMHLRSYVVQEGRIVMQGDRGFL
ncbi:hypothetical protein BJV78DRAFT_1169531 [Lactifluus subvellereus]|nr:hypothetical protein BJV78DRAFT_1169531 [Lactifluus subvellereus]